MPARTITDLEYRVREALQIFGANVSYLSGDPADTSPNTYIRAQINLAQEELARLAKYAIIEQSVTLVGGTAEYLLTSAIVDVPRAAWLGDNRLRRVNIEAIANRVRGYRAQSGTPQSYYLSTVSAGGIHRIGFYKKPNAGGTATILAAVSPVHMSNSQTTPQYLPIGYHDILVDGAVIRMANIDNLTPDKRARLDEHKEKWKLGIAALLSFVESAYGTDDAAVNDFDKLANPPTVRDIEDNN